MAPDPSSPRTAAERVGGPWALSWQVGVLAFIPAAVTATFDAARNDGSPVAWIACGLAASTVLFVTLIPVRRFLLPGLPRYRRPRPVLTIAVYLTAGAARGTLVAVLAVQFGLQGSYEWGFRQIAGALIATTALVILTFLVDAVASYRAGVRELVREEQRVALVEGAAERHREELVAEVHQRLLDALRNADGDADPSAPISATIDAVVHPLVDELRGDIDLRLPPAEAMPAVRVGARELLARSIWVAPLHPAPVAIALGATIVTFLALRFGPSGVLITIAFCGASALPLLAAKTSARRQHDQRPARIARIACAYLAILALNALVGVIATTSGPAAALGIGTVAVAVAIVTVYAWAINAAAAAISAAHQLTAIAAVDLRATNEARAWKIARAEESMRAVRASLASTVHGPVQTTLIRAAMPGHVGPDGDAMTWARREIEEILSGTRDHAHRAVHLDTAFAALTDVWDGAATVRFHADPVLVARLSADALGAGTILEIVREGISNAVRHAGARRVDVGLSLDDALATVTVTSDARRSTAQTRRGLGTDMLDRVCTSWERTVDGDITRLVARVPVEIVDLSDRTSNG